MASMLLPCLVQAERMFVDIAADEVTNALRALVEQTEVNLVFSKQQISGVRTQAVSGNMEPSEAVAQMIKQTPLGFFVDDSSGAIVIFRNQPYDDQSRNRSPGGNPVAESTNDQNNQNDTEMNTTPAPRRKYIGAMLGAFTLIVAPGLNGQTPAAVGDEEDVIELSPFTVSSDDDVGYYTNSTLAGSRLNSKLQTTPAALSVFNEGFLDDIAANSIYDAIDYSMAFSVDIMTENANHEQFSNGGITARGFPRSSDNSKDFFTSIISTDRYNIERMTFSRGPNSILFGIGNPGGIINSTTKRARMADFNMLEFQFDNHGSLRGVTDLNRELIEDKLSLRLNLLAADQHDNRDFNETETQRGHIAATFKPFEGTTIRADFEKGEVDRVFQRRWIARDGVSDWIAAGSNPVDFDAFRNSDGSIDFRAARSFAGDNEAAFTNGNRPLLVYQNGALVPHNGRYEVASNGSNRIRPELLETWDKDRGLAGPVNSSDHEFESYSAFVEQRIGENFFIEGAYRFEEEQRWIDAIVNHNSITPRLDVAPLLPNGQVNPNYDHYFMESNGQRTDQLNEIETMRLTASYSLDTGSEWLGRHRFAGLLQRVDRYNTSSRYTFANRTPLGNNNTVNGNRIPIRTYLSSPDRPQGERGFRGDPSEQSFGAFELLDPVTGASVGTVTPDWVLDRQRPQKAINDSWMIAGQSFWWDDRIALTYGYRDDSLDQWNFVETVAGNGDVAANPGLLRREVLASGLTDEPEVFAGDTSSLGLAVQPLKWLTLTANASENFSPQNRFNIFNENIGNVMAEGVDFSVRLTPGDGNRLYVVLNYFETDVVNAGENLFSYFTPINEIWDTLDANNIVDSPERIIENSVYSNDFTASGYELEVVANPTRNISLRANYTNRDNEVSDVGSEIVRYLDINLPIWTPHRDLELVDNSALTVGDRIDRVVNHLQDDRNEIGLASSDNVRERASFFGRYTFLDGALKGFDFGVGLRYTGDRIIQYLEEADGSLTPAHSNSWAEVDLKLGYKLKLAEGKVDWLLRLNVRNLFDVDDAIITQLESNTLEPRAYVLVRPRVISLTNTFRF